MGEKTTQQKLVLKLSCNLGTGQGTDMKSLTESLVHNQSILLQLAAGLENSSLFMDSNCDWSSIIGLYHQNKTISSI